MQKQVCDLKNRFLSGIAQFADNTVDLQMNNNVWKRAISFSGLHLLASISNFSIVNTEEKKITKQTVAALNFNQIRDYDHTFTYEDFLDNHLREFSVTDYGRKLDYIIGNDEDLEWELVSKAGVSYLYKINKPGLLSPIY